MRRIEIFRVAVDGVCGVLTENPIDTCGKATEYGASSELTTKRICGCMLVRRSTSTWSSSTSSRKPPTRARRPLRDQENWEKEQKDRRQAHSIAERPARKGRCNAAARSQARA